MASSFLLRAASAARPYKRAGASSRSIPSSTRFQSRPQPPYYTPAFTLFALFASSSKPTEYSKLQMAVKEIVDEAINDHTVAIFSKSYCPYCKRAKALIKDLNLPEGSVKILELDERSDGADIQNYLLETTKQRTVPNVFVNQQHIGGSDDLQQASSSGKLKELLASV